MTAVNDAPVAVDDSYGLNEDTTLNVDAAAGVLDNDTDAEIGDTLFATLLTGTSNGTVSLLGDGSFSYTPNANFNGSDSFTYLVSDGNGGSDTGTVNILVSPSNDAPTVGDASFTIAEDTAVDGPVGTVVATDIDGAGETLTYSITAGNDDGLFAIDSLTGAISVAGSLNFETQPVHELTVQVSDQGGLSNTATVTVNLTDVAEAGPTITALRVNSTAWTGLFRDFIDFDESIEPDLGRTNRFNDGQAQGYELPVGESQSVTLPWINLNQIIVTFDQDVVGFGAEDVTIDGIAGLRPDSTTASIPSVLNVEYDATTFTGVITLNQSIEASRLTIGIAASGVTDADGNNLDGGSSFGTDTTSASGGNFSFAINVLPGDFDKASGEQVDITDRDEIENINASLFESGNFRAANPDFTEFADINGSGAIDNADIIAASARTGSRLIAETEPPAEASFLFSPSSSQSADDDAKATSKVPVLEGNVESAAEELDSKLKLEKLDSEFASIADDAIESETDIETTNLSSLDDVFSELEVDF